LTLRRWGGEKFIYVKTLSDERFRKNGIIRFDLKEEDDYGKIGKLDLNETYEWCVAVQSPDDSHANDQLARGYITRTLYPEQAELGRLSEPQQAIRLAGAGLWYDAFEKLSEPLGADPLLADHAREFRLFRLEKLIRPGVQAELEWRRKTDPQDVKYTGFVEAEKFEKDELKLALSVQPLSSPRLMGLSSSVDSAAYGK
jgi:hypothetical protein